LLGRVVSITKSWLRHDLSRVVPTILRSNSGVEFNQSSDIILLQKSQNSREFSELSGKIEFVVRLHLCRGFQRPMGNRNTNMSETNSLQLLDVGFNNPTGPVITELLQFGGIVLVSLCVSVFVGNILRVQECGTKKLFKDQPSSKIDSINDGIVNGTRFCRSRQKRKKS